MSFTTPLGLSAHRAPKPNQSQPQRRIAPRSGPILTLIAWALVLVGLLVGLHLLGRGSLAAPPLAHPSLIVGWAAARGALTTAFALLRCLAELVSAYLLLTTLGGAVVRLAGLVRAVRVLDRLSVPVVRRLLSTLASVSLASVLSAGPAAHAVWAAPTAHTAPVSATAPDDWSIPVMKVVGAAKPPQPPSSPATWTVAPGDNLWAIAEATLTRRSRRSPTDVEVDHYWQRLIELNRSRLADQDTPELIFCGQVFVLPPT